MNGPDLLAVLPEAVRERARVLMEPARRAARRLAASGRLEVVQGRRVVDSSPGRGANRLHRPTSPSHERASW